MILLKIFVGGWDRLNTMNFERTYAFCSTNRVVRSFTIGVVYLVSGSQQPEFMSERESLV